MRMKSFWWRQVCIVVLSCASLSAFVAQIQARELAWSAPETIPMPYQPLYHGFDLEAGLGGDFHLLSGKSSSPAIYYGYRTGAEWNVEKITGSSYESMRNFSLATWLNIAVAVFYNQSTESLWWCSSIGGWARTEIPFGFPAEYMDLAILDGELHIALIRTDTPPFLWYIYSTDSHFGWYWETITTVSHDSSRLAFAIDDNGYAHFVWEDAEMQAVRYAYRNGPEDYSIETLHDVINCRWLDISIISPDIPYVGFLDYGDGTEDQTLRAAFRLGGDWIHELIASEQDIHHAGMAVAGQEGFSSENIYHVYCTGDTPSLKYAYWDNGRICKEIPRTDAFGEVFDVAAAWDPENDRAGIVFYESENLHFMTGMTNYPQSDLELDLWMNQVAYSDGEILWLSLAAANLGRARSVDLYVMMDIAGEYWFYPAWTHELDHFFADFADLETLDYSIIDPLVLPIPLAPGGPFYFYAAAFESGTLDTSTLISNVESVAFSFI